MMGRHRLDEREHGMRVRRRAPGDHARFVAEFEQPEPGTSAGSWWDPQLRAQVNADCRRQGVAQPFPRVHAGDDPSATIPLPVPHPRVRASR